jgi:hypothetical protein
VDRQALIQACERSAQDHGYLVFEQDELRSMSTTDVEAVREAFGSTVWDDLWGSVEAAPYLISLAFLDRFTGPGAIGEYVICDLQSQDNYFFSPLLFHDKESWDYMAAVKERFRENQKLSTAQALALEASVRELDIWHFAYRMGIDLDVAKRSVVELVDDRILLHVTKAEHLSEYFDVH